MKIFSGSSNKPLAEKIAEELNNHLSPLDIFIFPDGEKRVRVIDRVVDENCIVIAPTAPPVDSNYMELFLILDGLKRSGAKEIIAVIPYLGYQRQDHIFRDGEAVSLEVVINMLGATGVKKIICFDLHSMHTSELSKIPMKHLSALPIFVEEIKKIIGLSINDVVLISPDMGGVRRIKILSELLNNMSYAAIEKNRDLASGEISAENILEGNINNKKQAIIVDDMISSGKTLVLAAQMLKDKGIEEIYAFGTHPIFSNDASERLQASIIKKVFVTDSVYVPKDKMFDKLEILSISKLIAREIVETLSV